MATGVDYDPAYEWPGDSYSAPTSPTPNVTQDAPDRPTFRLLIARSSALSRRKRLAILDGYSEIQLARDAAPSGSTTPRIRLKELAVSKLHATIFWDEGRREWAVVDMGSKHGTFISSGRREGGTGQG